MALNVFKVKKKKKDQEKPSSAYILERYKSNQKSTELKDIHLFPVIMEPQRIP